MKDHKYLADILNHFKKRKGMYIQPVNVDTVTGFLMGFALAAHLPGFCTIAWKNGYKSHAAGPIPEMRRKGMADDQIMDELIDLQLKSLDEKTPAN